MKSDPWATAAEAACRTLPASTLTSLRFAISKSINDRNTIAARTDLKTMQFSSEHKFQRSFGNLSYRLAR
jgi:hypothetical protein